MVHVAHCRWRSTVAAMAVAASAASVPAVAVDDGSNPFGYGRQSSPAQPSYAPQQRQSGYQQSYNSDSNSYYRQQYDYNRQSYGSQQYSYGQQQDGASQPGFPGERRSDYGRSGERARAADTGGEDTPRRHHRHHRHFDRSEGDPPPPRRSRRVSTTLKGAGAGAYGPSGSGWGAYGQNAVCVRRCDGYFFPMGPVSSQTSLDAQKSLCTALCPDAKTELYFLPEGADGIATAVTEDGRPYSKMPNALHYTKTRDAACTCHAKEPQSHLVALMKDITIRRGDAVMTTNGVLVFNGAYTWPYRLANFQVLDRAKYYLRNALALAALEKAALHVQQVAKTPKDRKDKATPADVPATFITDNSGKTVRLVGEAQSYAPEGQPPQETDPTETAESQEKPATRATR